MAWGRTNQIGVLMPQVTMKDMLDAGVHFGHQIHRWNPKMKPFVFGSRGGIHIIDLQKSVAGARRAIDAVKQAASEGKKMIFVGTKQQAIEPIQTAANSCGQYFITKRWLGGTLTNFVTIKASIDRYKKLERMKAEGEWTLFSKKEQSQLDKELTRLVDYLEGIKEMKSPPGIIFVVDLIKEKIAIQEAKRLGIPVVGIADTNSDPTVIEFPIPGNDDAIRSIQLFSSLMAEAYNEGAKAYEDHLRAEGDKGNVAKAKAKTEKTAKDSDEKDSGPQVVKAAKRRMVAAGTAEEVEIQEEVEKELSDRTEDKPEETEETGEKS